MPWKENKTPFTFYNISPLERKCTLCNSLYNCFGFSSFKKADTENCVESLAKINSSDISVSVWIMLNYVAYFEIISKLHRLKKYNVCFKYFLNYCN